MKSNGEIETNETQKEIENQTTSNPNETIPQNE